MSVDPRMAQMQSGGNPGGGAPVKKGGGLVSAGPQIFSTLTGVIGIFAAVFTAFATINRFRIAAVLVWFVGVYTSSLVLENALNAFTATGFNPASQFDSITIGWYFSPLIGAFLMQFIFTTVEAPIFNRQGVNMLSLFVVVIDTYINTLVTRPIAEGFVNTGAYSNLVYTVETVFDAVGVNMSGAALQSDLAVTMLMLFGAVAIAAAPEMMWAMGKPRGPQR